MKRRLMTYKRAKEKHIGCYIELRYIAIDETYPNYEIMPVANAPAILVWEEKSLSVNDDGSNCTAIYWLQEED